MDGAPVVIPGAKPRAILTMLGLHGGAVVPADVLTELLWGDDPPRTAAKALQTHISSLRHTLGDGFVLTQGTGWRLNTAETDASRYQSLTKAGRDALGAGDTSTAVTRFDEAATLWRGIPELPDGRRGVSEKTRWIEAHAALVEDRADALLATGRAAEIIGDLEAAVADAPLRERRWGQLMLALYRAGRQGEALGAFKRAQSVLADELGVDPGPDLRRLEAAIVAQDTALEVPAVQSISSSMRAVTFLLTDIEGSTAAWEADAGAMAIALARHDELVEQVVTSRGGRLIKTRGEGDATFSVFDRPSAAASAAIELQDAIFHEPWALAEPMRIRIALHTGEAELRDGDYFGRAVNRAARLRSQASGGQILCSGATAELVIDSLSDDVALVDLGMRQLKNLARPEHIFELRLQTAESPPPAGDSPIERPAVPAVLAGPGPFVGRGRELAELLAAWHQTVIAGTRAVLIAGEPGVGKTRLAGEWCRQAYEQGALVLYGRSDEDLGAPYQPFAEALRTLVPGVGSDRLRGMRGIEALLPLVPGLTDVLPDVAAPPHGDPDTERYALFDAVVALLGIASLDVPIVLVLDDLHWAAKPTLLLLRHLLRFGEHARVQIVGTYRSTDLDRSHPLAAMLADLHRDGSAERIALNGLDEDDVTAYVAEAGYDDEELARALASVTGGNPFFLIQALRHVDESGGYWDPSTLPQGVREAVSRRLSRLPLETNKALAAAAVVGSQFALDLVEQVVGQDLVDAFDEACQAGILIEEPGGLYRFNHAIVRQSLLAELASVRRMRLHQRIAAALENLPGAGDELLADLAHHYFECAWAGNAVKAVEYCRRAADQAMARLAYEGAADLYDHALHALDELDDELPDRDDQRVELLVARCEALLAAGDVCSAAGAVSQLKEGTRDSARLAAWATCFDGQLSMLVDPERLDEIETAVRAAAETLAELDDNAGEAKAHTVRAGCLARLGRIGDCEVALDNALTAARRAGEHRRVNAVLAGAPLAALWGPNPVPRAGGRCLDVVRLLRITTDSPAVEATSTRCQAVLEAFRGRAAAARRMIDSARRTVTELGLRHALLEVEHFAGIVELVVDDPAAAESHLRLAYNGFRRMGLDADTAETAAVLGRACLLLEREDEAEQLCADSERLAGHALKASIAWRTVRAQLLARDGSYDEARRVAEEAVALAERTDALVDHGDACLALAMVLAAAGDVAGTRAAAQRGVERYELKGAVALAEKARRLVGKQDVPTPPAAPGVPAVEFDNACVRAIRRLSSAVDRQAWAEYEEMLASNVTVESHRKIVGFPRAVFSSTEWAQQVAQLPGIGAVRHDITFVATRGDRLALSRLVIATADQSPGAPEEEWLQLQGLDKEGRIDLVMWFDVDDIDAAIDELNSLQARFEAPVDIHTVAIEAYERAAAAIDAGAWDQFELMFDPEGFVESRRKLVGFKRTEFSAHDVVHQTRCDLENGIMRANHVIVAARGERLALARVIVSTVDESPGAPQDEFLQVYGVGEDGRFALQIWFDLNDLDAALTELDSQHAQVEAPTPRPLDNACVQAIRDLGDAADGGAWGQFERLFAPDAVFESRRKIIGFAPSDIQSRAWARGYRTLLETGALREKATVIATRGERLALARLELSSQDVSPGAPRDEILQLYGIDRKGRFTLRVLFDLDDFDSAIEELDTRYLAGEAAPHAPSWSIVMQVYAALNRREIPATTSDWVTVDHQRGRSLTFAAGEVEANIRDSWNQIIGGRIVINVVHRLTDRGAVVTHTARGTANTGLDVEWRYTNVLIIKGNLIDRCEMFDEADLDAALAKFDELSQPVRRLENSASEATDRFMERFAAHDWDTMAQMVIDDISFEDRRRVINADLQIGRDAFIENFRIAADLGATQSPTSIATRGERVVLTRARFSLNGGAPDEFGLDLLHVIEIAADNRIAATVTFDPDDTDAAVAELDARYLADEAASYAHTWSAVMGAYAALNRHELPGTTADHVSLDHRRVTSFAPGDIKVYTRLAWNQMPDISFRIAAVHQLNGLGAVVTHVLHGTSQEGFEAEWSEIHLLTLDGELFNRSEMFDGSDLDTALARFDELDPQVTQPGNAASRMYERLQDCLADRDLDAIAAMLADNFYADDRRHVVSAAVRHGRDAALEDARAVTDLGARHIAATVVATRGEHFALRRSRYAVGDRAEAFQVDLLEVIALDTNGHIAALVTFDPDDVNSAFAELDARYIAGEPTPHADTWSVIVDAFAALNRHDLPVTSPDFVDLDHRRVANIAAGGMQALLRTALDLTPVFSSYVEAVHRLAELGAVVTQVAHGTSDEGFDAEWRTIELLTVEAGMVNRCEVFDETDLDAALARLEELRTRVPHLGNAASLVDQRFWGDFSDRNWHAMAEILTGDFLLDDRRQALNAGLRQGRETEIDNVKVMADVTGPLNVTGNVIATRGERLALRRLRFSTQDQDPDTFYAEMVGVVEINANRQLAAHIVFDPDDIDAAFDELDARYLAGEAAAYTDVWSVITAAQAAFEQHEFPATTPDMPYIDHRPVLSIGTVDAASVIDAIWDVIPDPSVYIEAVHRLSGLGAVVTQTLKGTSREGFEGEWRLIGLFTVDHNLISRCEVFDEADLDAALARFDELRRPLPRLDNAATRIWARLADAFNRRDLTGLLALMTTDGQTDDRRKGLSSSLRGGQARHKAMESAFEVAPNGLRMNVETVATRGSRLMLSHDSCRDTNETGQPVTVELLTVVGVSDDGLIHDTVSFDLGDIDAALKELDARYLAGEAAPYARTWSAVVSGYAALNRHELPSATPDLVNIDHRPGVAFVPGDLFAYIQASWDVSPDLKIHIETAHRLNKLGTVITQAASGSSREGFDAEWRQVVVFTVDGDEVNRCEMYEESNLDAALARFDELGQQPST